MTTTESLLDRLTAEFGDGARLTSPYDAGAWTWSTSGYDLLWRETGSDTALRGAWNDHKGRGPRPLVLLTPSSDQSKVRVCGPQHPRPIRELPFEPVLNLLRDAVELHFNEAAQTLAREFIRLEEAAIPGLRVKELLTPHFVQQRLRGSRPQLDEVISEVTPADSREWRSLFRRLGYQIERLPLRGHLLRDASEAPIAVVHPSSDPDSFGQLTKDAALPEGLLLADCDRHGADWGLLAAGGRYRLFQRRPESGAAGGQYLEIDANDLTRESRYCLGLLSPQSLREHGWLEGWAREARDFGEELRKGLEYRLIRDVLPSIARGLGEHLESEGIDPGEPDQIERIGESALTLVFRFMFLLHVEARGYLPVNSPVYSRHSATGLARECHEILASVPGDKTSTRVWDDLGTLVGMIRRGDTDAGVPAYNGQLFAADGFPGSELLEEASITNAHLAPALDGIAYDTDRADAPGLDYAGLQIGHLGAIYEALLSMKLSSAPEDLIYDKKRKVYRPARAGEESEVTRRDLFYQSEKGDRKAGGVFYTRHEFVRHLLRHSLEPALDDHLQAVRETLKHDPGAAARMLFDFSVLDPAMGSAHFLTVALDVMADRYGTFLAEVDGFPAIKDQLDELRRDDLPGVRPPEDGELMRRLILKRCIYGVDISPMAVEVANITLWLASFVPGLALSWLDGNLKCGNSLIGVADVDVVGQAKPKRGGRTAPVRAATLMSSAPVQRAMQEASDLQQAIADNPDLTPEEVQRSRALADQLAATTSGLRDVFDLWTADPLGLGGARDQINTVAVDIVQGNPGDAENAIQDAESLAAQHGFFHWPLEFPSVFHRARPGFDVVVGNPPWKKVMFELPKFVALHDPGVRGIRNIRKRDARIEQLFVDHPRLRAQAVEARERDDLQRSFFKPANGYTMQGSGHTDLYKLFCERYARLTRPGGNVGVVLPRVAFLNDGSRGFRQWLFGTCRPTRVDALLNDARWAFDMEPRYTVALLSAQIDTQGDGLLRVSGPSRSLDDFHSAAKDEFVSIDLQQLASTTVPAGSSTPGYEVPLVETQRHVDVLAKLQRGVRFDSLVLPASVGDPHRGQALQPYQTQEVNETNQKSLFAHLPGRRKVPVWKGRSFDQYDPHGRDPAGYANWDEVLHFVQGKRLKAREPALHLARELLENPATHPINRARLAYRAVASRTNSRTIIGCLVPPRVALSHAAPYYSWRQRATAPVIASSIGVMNSLTFDWQARRYVESNVVFFILNMLCFPHWDNADWQRIGHLAARLSCVDERFADFAAEVGVEHGPLTDAEHKDMRAEIDALVAQGYGLDVDELRFIFTDFTLDAVPEHYRELVVAKFEALS